jgi:hypothetical protein
MGSITVLDRALLKGMPALEQGTSLVSEKVAKSEQTSPLNRCNNVGEYRVECETSQIGVARQ